MNRSTLDRDTARNLLEIAVDNYLGHRPYVPNERLRHMRIGDARVSKADGSQSLAEFEWELIRERTLAVSYGSVKLLRGQADGKARRDAQMILNHTGAIECLVGAARVASFHCRPSSAMMRYADDGVPRQEQLEAGQGDLDLK